VLHLKDDAKEYAHEWPVREVVRKYSDYVRWPIRMEVERGDGDEKKVEWQTLNQARACGRARRARSPTSSTQEFYKSLSHDWQEPLAWTHFKVEGTHELTGLLYVPAKAPFDLVERRKSGVQLFVKRVFIMDDAQEIVPEWLRFVRGVVDSEDLPLNVSREILQKDATTRFIQKAGRRQDAARARGAGRRRRDRAHAKWRRAETKQKVRRYRPFWSEFGPHGEGGRLHDSRRATASRQLLRFRSSHGDGLARTQGLHESACRPTRRRSTTSAADSLAVARRARTSRRSRSAAARCC
jgi:molecular chaperone HtpG